MTLSPYEKTKRWIFGIISAILVLVGLVIFKSCDKKKIKDITNEELKNDEKTAVIVGTDGKVTTITRKNGRRTGSSSPLLRGREPESERDAVSVKKGTDGARETRVSIGEDGKVRITERTYGFLAEFGTGIYTTSRDVRIFVDYQPLFYRRHGLNLNVGFTLNGSKKIRPGVAYSYLLPFKYLSNSSLIIGLDSDKDVFGGVRVRF